MGDAEITTSAWRLVEVGRVVIINDGKYEGRLATIVEIIDHKRVRICCGPFAVQQLTTTGTRRWPFGEKPRSPTIGCARKTLPHSNRHSQTTPCQRSRPCCEEVGGGQGSTEI